MWQKWKRVKEMTYVFVELTDTHIFLVTNHSSQNISENK